MSKTPPFKKPPVIRKGQKKPYRKGTQAEVESRIAEVEIMLGRHMRKMSIHKFMREKHGIEWRMADYYITHARDNMLERLRQTKESHRCQSLALYEEILISGNAREKMLAQERIDKLLGLEQPRSLNIGGIDGAAPIKFTSSKYDARKLPVSDLKNLKTILQNAKVEQEKTS